MRARWSRGGGGLVAVTCGANGGGGALVDALVYHSGGRLRRVEFSAGGPRRTWERKLSLSPRPGAFGRVGNLVVLERDGGGVDAYSVETGELHWHVEHPAELAGPLLLRPDGLLLLVFSDDCWNLIDPVSGKRRDRGPTRGAVFHAIGEGAEVLGAVPQALHRQGRCHLSDDRAEVVAERRHYRPEGWRLGEVLLHAGERLFVALERDGEGSRVGGVALLAWPDLEPRAVVELGQVGDERERDAVARVDDAALLRLGHTTAVFDGAGRLAARLAIGEPACVFGEDGAICWRGKL